jgi:hypothetical protein
MAVNPFYTGYKISLTPRLYLDEENNWFLSSELFYRNWSKKRGYLEFDGSEIEESYSFAGDRKENVNVYGFKLLFGFSEFMLQLGKRSEFNFCAFTGLGWRTKSYEFETWNGTINEEQVAYVKETGTKQALSFHLGLLIGIGFSSNSE